MNAFQRTALGISLGVTCTPRARQTVTRVISSHGGNRPARHVVLVTPHGSDEGEYFEVSDRGRELLESGRTPDWLQLDAFEPSDERNV